MHGRRYTDPVRHRDGVDTTATSAAYRAAAALAGPDATAPSRTIWARLDSDRWTLEWHLPLWLGDAFGLDRGLACQLVTSNVLGLASLRVADDLADGEIAADDLAPARRLAATLYDAALMPYRDLFGSDHAFWARLDRWMAEWRGASERAARRLAARGAPLKIPALAICLLTNRTDDFPALERCLDHALRALVLYDHACDWREDLAAGRWNAFAGAGRDPSRFEAALLSGAVIGPYFARIDRELAPATRIAVELNIVGLANHLSSQRASIEAQGRALESRHDALGIAATRLVFGEYAT